MTKPTTPGIAELLDELHTATILLGSASPRGTRTRQAQARAAVLAHVADLQAKLDAAMRAVELGEQVYQCAHDGEGPMDKWWHATTIELHRIHAAIAQRGGKGDAS